MNASQRNLFCYGVVTARRSGARGDHISVSDRRKQEATRLGLYWPLRGGTRRVGRPALQDVWEATVSQALRENRFDEVSLLRDRHVPEWYRGGRAIVQPTESVDVAHKVEGWRGNASCQATEGHRPITCSEMALVMEWSNAGPWLELASLSPRGEGHVPRAVRGPQREPFFV